MRVFIRRHLTYANVMATVAVFIALGGVGYAAATIGTAQIKNSAVTRPKIKAGAVTNSRLGPKAVSTSKLNTDAVTGSKIAPDAITAGDVADGQVIEGRGTMTVRHLPVFNFTETLASFPGLGSLRATCKGGVGQTSFFNFMVHTEAVSYWGVNSGTPPAPIIGNGSLGIGQVLSAPPTVTSAEHQGITWHMAYMNPLDGVQHVAQATVSLAPQNYGGGEFCRATVQATYSG